MSARCTRYSPAMRKTLTMAMAALFTVAGAAALAGAGPAAADEESQATGIQVIAQGETATGGWVQFTGTGQVVVDGETPEGSIGTRAIAKVGGGTWSYGASLNAGGKKVCRSHYMHPSVGHGATVKMNGKTRSAWAPAGGLAAADYAEYTRSGSGWRSAQAVFASRVSF